MPSPLFKFRRRFCLAIAGIVGLPLTACSSDSLSDESPSMNKDKREVLYFDVNLYSYLERPIHDVYLNGRFIGDAAGQPHRGAGGVITGVPVPLGSQVVTWKLDGPEGMPGNGDQVIAANQPILERPDPKLTYLGVHIYPDNTVELAPEQFWPEKTERGMEINRQWEEQYGRQWDEQRRVNEGKQNEQ
jgi:hypothetical protein